MMQLDNIKGFMAWQSLAIQVQALPSRVVEMRLEPGKFRLLPLSDNLSVTALLRIPMPEKLA